jgi:hypothetical protein
MSTGNTTRVKPFNLGWIYRQQKEWPLLQVRITWQLCKKKNRQQQWTSNLKWWSVVKGKKKTKNQKACFPPSQITTVIVQKPFDPEATALND